MKIGIAILGLIISTVAFAQSDKLYHIVSKSDWRKYSDGTVYTPASLVKDGFIHFSNKDQILGTANIHFKGEHGLLLIELEVPPKDPLLKWETSPGAPGGRKDLFPHYYGKLSLAAVKKVYIFEPNADGTFSFPTKTFEQ